MSINPVTGSLVELVGTEQKFYFALLLKKLYFNCRRVAIHNLTGVNRPNGVLGSTVLLGESFAL